MLTLSSAYWGRDISGSGLELVATVLLPATLVALEDCSLVVTDGRAVEVEVDRPGQRCSSRSELAIACLAAMWGFVSGQLIGTNNISTLHPSSTPPVTLESGAFVVSIGEMLELDIARQIMSQSRSKVA